MKNIATKAFDILGISSATLCLIHCIVFPLLTVIPLGFSHNPYVDLFFALLGVWAVLRVIKTAHKFIVALLLTSIALIFAGVLMDVFLHFHSNLIFMGGIGMIVGHLLNYKNHKHHS